MGGCMRVPASFITAYKYSKLHCAHWHSVVRCPAAHILLCGHWWPWPLHRSNGMVCNDVDIDMLLGELPQGCLQQRGRQGPDDPS